MVGLITNRLRDVGSRNIKGHGSGIEEGGGGVGGTQK